jgi:hypothetical protein
MKYRKKQVIVEAVRWWKHGDHPAVTRLRFPMRRGSMCSHCETRDHGWIETIEGGHIVCPGDWIITGVKGEHYPCRPDIFAATHEEASDDLTDQALDKLDAIKGDLCQVAALRHIATLEKVKQETRDKQAPDGIAARAFITGYLEGLAFAIENAKRLLVPATDRWDA